MSSKSKPKALEELRASLPLRKGVGAVIFNGDGQVWIGSRAPRAGRKIENYWQMPQGGIDKGEDPAEAVIREVAEETGTDKVEILEETSEWIDYDLPDDLIGVAWGGKYRGQRQKWYALKFTGEDSDFDLEAHDKPEFTEWRWADLAGLPALIVPFKRSLYTEVVAAFEHWPKKIRKQKT